MRCRQLAPPLPSPSHALLERRCSRSWGVLPTDRVRLACCVRRSRRLDEWLFPARARFDLENTSPSLKPALPQALACDWTSLLVPTLTVCRAVRGAQSWTGALHPAGMPSSSCACVLFGFVGVLAQSGIEPSDPCLKCVSTTSCEYIRADYRPLYCNGDLSSASIDGKSAMRCSVGFTGCYPDTTCGCTYYKPPPPPPPPPAPPRPPTPIAPPPSHPYVVCHMVDGKVVCPPMPGDFDLGTVLGPAAALLLLSSVCAALYMCNRHPGKLTQLLRKCCCCCCSAEGQKELIHDAVEQGSARTSAPAGDSVGTTNRSLTSGKEVIVELREG